MKKHKSLMRRIEKLEELVLASEFDESEHPREKGKFARKGGNSGSGSPAHDSNIAAWQSTYPADKLSDKAVAASIKSGTEHAYFKKDPKDGLSFHDEDAVAATSSETPRAERVRISGDLADKHDEAGALHLKAATAAKSSNDVPSYRANMSAYNAHTAAATAWRQAQDANRTKRDRAKLSSKKLSGGLRLEPNDLIKDAESRGKKS